MSWPILYFKALASGDTLTCTLPWLLLNFHFTHLLGCTTHWWKPGGDSWSVFPSPEKVGYPPASDVSISLFSPSQRDVDCCVVVISVTQPSLFYTLFFQVRASSHLHPSLPTSYAGAGIISASKCHFHSASKVPLLFLLKHPRMFIEYLLSSFRLFFIVFLGKKKKLVQALACVDLGKCSL